jgi:hypothetical protein
MELICKLPKGVSLVRRPARNPAEKNSVVVMFFQVR